jgi:alkylhydroperoxidase family enzyme
MRIPYTPEKPTAHHPEEQAYINRMLTKRSGNLSPLDRALLHSPPFAAGFMHFFGAICGQYIIPADIMEVAVCRVAALNGAAFQWLHHAPLVLRAQVGLDGLETVRTAPLHATPQGERDNTDHDGTRQGLSDDLWAVMRYVDCMTKDVKVPDEVVEGIKRILNERQVVELSKSSILSIHTGRREWELMPCSTYNRGI